MILSKFYSTLKTLNFIRNSYISIHTYIYKMDKAYMRCPEGSEVFELSFQYFNPELKLNRQFNFSRKLSETVSAFLGRVSTNVDKILNKKLKKKKAEEIDSSASKIFLYQNGQEVDGDKLCSDLFQIGGDIRLKLIDTEYQVVINTPWITNISLPSSMLANFSVYPSKLETLFVDLRLSEFTWHKSADKVKWTLAGTGFLYTPTTSDISSYLKLNFLPKNGKDVGPCTEVISSDTVQADPGQCPFEIRHQFTKDNLTGKEFRIVSYNLLADLYCDSEYSRTVLFPYCPPYALNIDYRKQLILKELLGYNSDIICLQEVDDKIFENDLKPVLSTKSFDGIYSKKGGSLREGLACFYNSARFKLISSLPITLGEELNSNPLFTDLWSKISQNENLAKRLTERSTTLQLTALEFIENTEVLLIANTHFYFHPDADHIRLLQAGIASIYIEDFVRQLQMNSTKPVSVLFCGDFNTVPECGIYKLFTTGFVPEDFVDWQSNEEEAVQGVTLVQKRLMSSACGTPEYTNFTAGFKDCLDYIFYEKSKFEVTQVVPLPSVEELSVHIAIPSILVPSDHIALIADLKLL